MNIRSLTGFLTFADPTADSSLRAFGELVRAARDAFSSAAFPLQTARVATQPISELKPRDLSQFARDLQSVCQAHEVDYASLGAMQADARDAPLDLFSAIPDALRATENVFASAQIASREHGINLGAIQAAARVMHTLAHTTPDGFGNFRFAALANCAPHAPFFPVAYQRGDEPAFGLAAETAPLAVAAFTRAQNLDEARVLFVGAMEAAAEKITRVANDLAARFAFRFLGIDFSTAPFPEESKSIGTALERLTGARFGEHGTLFAAAFVTDCIARANFPRAGFNGLMLPVLEDATLAARSSQITIHQLLLLSTVCGTGLDTIPLPGETTADALAALLLDLATLAVKLNKPLTARLIPIPGLSAGDLTQFNFEYFANARVLGLDARALKVFASDEHVQFR